MEHYCVNGRYIKSSVIARAVEEGYGNLMMQHSFPFCILLIDIDPAAVDMTVHPTKREIRFSDSQAVYDFLKMAVEGACRPAQLAQPRRADHFVGDVEERVQPYPAAVPHPDAAVAVSVPEVL